MNLKRNLLGLFLLMSVLISVNAQMTDYLNEINTLTQFLNYSGEPLASKYTNISSVKIIVRKKDNRVYFINSKYYKLHFEFVSQFLHEYQDLEQFNQANYSDSKNRIFYLANLNYDTFSKRFFIDFSPVDVISSENIQKVYSGIRDNFNIRDSLYILLNTPRILAMKKYFTEHNVPVTEPQDIYKNQRLQVISTGKSDGNLIYYQEGAIDNTKDFSSCILIVDGNMNDIPICRGIISLSLQTPLSHICILSYKSDIPAIALPDFKKDSSLNRLIGKNIRLIVKKDSFMIQKVDSDFIKESFKRIKKPIQLKVDTSTRKIIDLSDISLDDVKTVGAKAANLGDLQTIKRFSANIPEGACAIPIAYYFDHIRKSGADYYIKLLDNPEISHDEFVQIVKKIRKSILHTPVDTNLINSISTKLSAFVGIGNHFRFRSSSNAEDRNFFSGAGLYESKTAILGDSIKTIERAIKKVWASLWSLRASEARKYWNIDNQTVGMGILIHRSFPDEEANGVIITRNLYRDVSFGFVINAQAGDVSVVLPDDRIQCDQLISYYNIQSAMFNKSNSSDYITFSSINNNKPVLSDAQIKFLTQQAELIKQHFYYRWRIWKETDYKDFALDIEFKIDQDTHGNLSAYIKQVRPF